MSVQLIRSSKSTLTGFPASLRGTLSVTRIYYYVSLHINLRLVIIFNIYLNEKYLFLTLPLRIPSCPVRPATTETTSASHVQYQLPEAGMANIRQLAEAAGLETETTISPISNLPSQLCRGTS